MDLCLVNANVQAPIYMGLKELAEEKNQERNYVYYQYLNNIKEKREPIARQNGLSSEYAYDLR